MRFDLASFSKRQRKRSYKAKESAVATLCAEARGRSPTFPSALHVRIADPCLNFQPRCPEQSHTAATQNRTEQKSSKLRNGVASLRFALALGRAALFHGLVGDAALPGPIFAVPGVCQRGIEQKA